jgi:ABC-type phosphate/phosphonate transport system permease subunit
MALTDDLKSLEELHAKGKLSDQEFAAAKAAAISSAGTAGQYAAAPQRAIAPTDQKQKKPSTFGRLLFVAILAVILWVYFQGHLTKPAATIIKEAVHMPVELRNETFTVAARGSKAIEIQVPYNGSLTINAHVLGNGNAMEMFLTNQSGLEKLQATNQGTYLGGFYAVKASSFQHTERMNQGPYYFVVRDRHFGILSATASDVSLDARVDP